MSVKIYTDRVGDDQTHEEFLKILRECLDQSKSIDRINEVNVYSTRDEFFSSAPFKPSKVLLIPRIKYDGGFKVFPSFEDMKNERFLHFTTNEIKFILYHEIAHLQESKVNKVALWMKGLTANPTILVFGIYRRYWGLVGSAILFNHAVGHFQRMNEFYADKRAIEWSGNPEDIRTLQKFGPDNQTNIWGIINDWYDILICGTSHPRDEQRINAILK